MKVRLGVSVGPGVLVKDGVLVGISDGRFVAVHSREAVGEAGKIRWGTFPVKIIYIPAATTTNKINANPK